MKVLYVMWESFGAEDILLEFNRREYEVDRYWLNRKADMFINQRLEQEMVQKLSEKKYDFVFSSNYFPVIAIACNACDTRYVSWVYDSPLMSLWHCSVVSPNNYIFVFDKTDYLELKKKGINTIYYLPLAANVDRYDSYTMDEELKEVYSSEISFIGSTYTENKFREYKYLYKLNEYDKGYIEGLASAQKLVYGNLLLEQMMTPDIIEKLKETNHAAMREDTFFGYPKYYGQVVLTRLITAMERQEVLEMLSEKYPVHLYTNKSTPSLPKIINRGMAGSKKEASYIFRSSKINLNITLRAIRSGVPLRAFEIMGSGGFLLSNYQEDFLDCFDPGVDFVYYDSYDDLMEKVEYYLSHEKERQEIAQNGYEKVKNYHTYSNRMDAMLEVMDLK